MKKRYLKPYIRLESNSKNNDTKYRSRKHVNAKTDVSYLPAILGVGVMKWI